MNRQNRSEGALPTRRAENRRREKSERKEVQSPLIRMLRGAGIGVLAGSLFSVLLLLIAAGVVYSQSDPDALLYPAALLVLGVASLLCGVIAERMSNAAFLPTGLITAGLWLLLTFLLSLISNGGAGALPSVYAWALRIPQAILVLFGAFLGKNRPRKIESRRRHR